MTWLKRNMIIVIVTTVIFPICFVIGMNWGYTFWDGFKEQQEIEKQEQEKLLGKYLTNSVGLLNNK